MSWSQDIKALVAGPPMPEAYRLRPTLTGAVVRCDTCAQDVAGPSELLADLLAGANEHQRVNHVRVG